MSVTAEATLFHHEYERELETWLRRRFRFLCSAYWLLELVYLLANVIAIVVAASLNEGNLTNNFVNVAGAGLGLLVIGAYLFRRTEQLETRAELLRAAGQVIMMLGAISLGTEAVARAIGLTGAGSMIFSLGFWHFTACLILPWRPIESLKPMVPLLVAWGVMVVITEVRADRIPQAVIFPPLGWLILLPGLAISGWRLGRHSREFHKAMVGRMFSSMRRELAEARTIHESMFPARFDDGHVRFEYEYKPMREMGGDFVHLEVSPTGVVHLLLLDVTGHGLAAALTVNRIYGELERIRAESPNAEPGEVIRLLNRYVHLTMASRHNIYATALALMFEPYEGELQWANAGHPPAFLRNVNGRISELQATGVLLGALADGEFTVDQVVERMEPGDSLVAFTDGAFETQNRRGEQFGLSNVRETMRRPTAPANWASFLSSLVTRHSGGRSQDDVLVVALSYLRPRSEQRLTSEAAPLSTSVAAVSAPARS